MNEFTFPSLSKEKKIIDFDSRWLILIYNEGKQTNKPKNYCLSFERKGKQIRNEF